MSHVLVAFLSFVGHIHAIAQHIAHAGLMHVMTGSGSLSG
jgi:hypothetical protein